MAQRTSNSCTMSPHHVSTPGLTRSSKKHCLFFFRGRPYRLFATLGKQMHFGFPFGGVQRVLRTPQLHGRVKQVARVMQRRHILRHGTPDAYADSAKHVPQKERPTASPHQNQAPHVPCALPRSSPFFFSFLFESCVVVSLCLCVWCVCVWSKRNEK